MMLIFMLLCSEERKKENKDYFKFYQFYDYFCEEIINER